MKRAGGFFAVLYIGTVFAANAAITTWGVVPVGFGLAAPAGVYFAGLALGLRDAVQDTLGRGWVLAAIVAGAACSALVASGRIALASGLAFGFSELADLVVYTPIRRRNWPGAVLASNAVGAVVDSALFLAVAGFPLSLMAGQVYGKAIATFAFMALAAPVVWRRKAQVFV